MKIITIIKITTLLLKLGMTILVICTCKLDDSTHSDPTARNARGIGSAHKRTTYFRTGIHQGLGPRDLGLKMPLSGSHFQP